MSGWICSYRAIWSHPIFKGNAARVGVWDWMLKTAAWKDTRFRVGGQDITVRRGQLCVSQRQIAEETGMGRQQVRTFLTALEREGAILTRPATKLTQGRSLITICKYDNYQHQEKRTNPTATQDQPTKEQGNTSSPIGEGASAPINVSVVTTAAWNLGKQYLGSHGVNNPGSMIGRWLSDHPALSILSAIEEAQKAGTQDPIPYITKVLKGGGNASSVKATGKSQERVNAFVAGARGS